MLCIGSRSLADYPSSVVRIECPRCGKLWQRPHAAKSPVATTTSWDLEKDDVQADPTTLSGKAGTAG